MVLYTATRYLGGLEKPGIASACEHAASSMFLNRGCMGIVADSITVVPENSIDYVATEKANDAVVVPVDAG